MGVQQTISCSTVEVNVRLSVQVPRSGVNIPIMTREHPQALKVPVVMLRIFSDGQSCGDGSAEMSGVSSGISGGKTRTRSKLTHRPLFRWFW